MECLQYEEVGRDVVKLSLSVLNLVINGMPSILRLILHPYYPPLLCFKPCYKWNAFNTLEVAKELIKFFNSFKPCYKWNAFNTNTCLRNFFNPSSCFKPCYKWNAFNTERYGVLSF